MPSSALLPDRTRDRTRKRTHRSFAGAARHVLSSRVTAWAVAGAAAVVALGAILFPRNSVSPDAASFTGLPQVGALFQGAWQSNPHFCTASVVDSPSGDVIATAAHCLSGNAKDLEFVPMYHDGQAPYGQWNVTGAYVSQRWMRDQDPQADFAFLTVSPQHTGATQRTVQSVVGGDALVIGRPLPRSAVVVGYPAGSGGQPVICLNQPFARDGYPAFRCGGFVSGTSGGPWLAEYNTQTGRGDLYGVTGGRHQGGCVSWVSYSSSFSADTMAVYERAVAGQQPDVIPAAQPAPC
jgi:hypothetical protein